MCSPIVAKLLPGYTASQNPALRGADPDQLITVEEIPRLDILGSLDEVEGGAE